MLSEGTLFHFGVLLLLLLPWMWEESGLLRWDVGAARFSVTARSSKDWCLLFDSLNIQCVCSVVM